MTSGTCVCIMLTAIHTYTYIYVYIYRFVCDSDIDMCVHIYTYIHTYNMQCTLYITFILYATYNFYCVMLYNITVFIIYCYIKCILSVLDSLGLESSSPVSASFFISSLLRSSNCTYVRPSTYALDVLYSFI